MSARGFTLIEMLITLALLGLLAGVAYPAYQGYVTTAREKAAQQFLVDISNAEENYRADTLTYISNYGSGGLNLDVPARIVNYYSFTVTNVSATTYTISATPQGGQSGPVLTLNQAGARNW